MSELITWLGNVPNVRPMHFIGQSAGKGEGERGMLQKEQREVCCPLRSPLTLA